jgi:hypothetical protein
MCQRKQSKSECGQRWSNVLSLQFLTLKRNNAVRCNVKGGQPVFESRILVTSHRRFGGACCLYSRELAVQQAWTVDTLKMEVIRSSDTSVSYSYLPVDTAQLHRGLAPSGLIMFLTTHSVCQSVTPCACETNNDSGYINLAVHKITTGL